MRTSAAIFSDLGPLHELEHRVRIHEFHQRRARGVLAHHHVAGQERADLRLGFERARGELWIAGAEDLEGGRSSPSFFFSVAATSISVSTPKPSLEALA